MTGPSVTVIVTFYNSVAFVDPALRGVADAIAGHDAEVIVVDDCSGDATWDRLQAWPAADAGISSYRPLRTPRNVGPAGARNLAVEQASGEYVWFVDCDDRWSADILTALVSGTDAGPDIVVCPAVHARDESDTFPARLDGLPERRTVDRRGALALLLEGRIRGYLWNKLIRTALLQAHPFEPLSSQSDFLAIVTILSDPRTTAVTFVPDGLYTHIARPGSITNSASSKLANIRRCWETARTAALAAGAVGVDDPQLVFFDYFQYYASTIDIFHRSGSQAADDLAVVADVKRAMHASDLVRIARAGHRRLALDWSLMLLPTPAYGTARTWVHRLGTVRRNASRRLTRATVRAA